MRITAAGVSRSTVIASSPVRTPRAAMAAIRQGEGQEAADGVVVLDDEHSRQDGFDHCGWIITGDLAETPVLAHTFHRPVTVCVRRCAQSLVLWWQPHVSMVSRSIRSPLG